MTPRCLQGPNISSKMTPQGAENDPNSAKNDPRSASEDQFIRDSIDPIDSKAQRTARSALNKHNNTILVLFKKRPSSAQCPLIVFISVSHNKVGRLHVKNTVDCEASRAKESLHGGSYGAGDAGWEGGGIAQGVSKESSVIVRAVADTAGV